MYTKGPFGKALDVAAQVTGGVCPTCTYETMFVSLSPELFRCMNCGSDCKQYINGSINFLKKVKMAKVPKYGVNTYHKQTKKKRPGRHKKSRNKDEKRMGSYLPQTGT
mgnify:CR=1 FL=1